MAAVVVELLPDLLHLPAPAVHQLDDAVGRARQQQRDGAQDDAPVDVRSLASLEGRIKCAELISTSLVPW